MEELPTNIVIGYGEAMSRYMVKFETMKLLLTVPQHAKTEQIVRYPSRVEGPFLTRLASRNLPSI